MTKIRQASWVGLTLIIAMLAGCGGCGGEKTRKKSGPSGKPERTETVFGASAGIPGETHYTPPSVVPTPVPTPVLRVMHPQVLDLSPQASGDAQAGLLESSFLGAVGVMAAGQHGDYVLSNSAAKFVFRAIEKRKEGTPVEAPLVFSNRRHAGSLVDVLLPGSPVDFLDEFTQALGTEPDGPVVEYDSVRFVSRQESQEMTIESMSKSKPEFVVRPAAVGIELTGSLAKSETEEVRIQTEYWLESGATRLDVETKIISGNPETSVSDFANFGPANIIASTHGVPPRGGAVLETPWCAAQLGRIALGLAVQGGGLQGFFQGNLVRVRVQHPLRRSPVRRTLFVGEGNFSTVTDQIFTRLNPGEPYATFKGQVVDKDFRQPAGGTWVDVFYYDRDDPHAIQNRRTFTRVKADDAGAFQCYLPILDKQSNEGRYFIGTGARSRQFGISERGLNLRPGAVDERTMQVGRPAALKVRVIDAQTSEPLTARIRFDAIAPALPSNFDNIESASGYANSFYAPREGGAIELNQGFYTLTASHGISYNLGRVDVEMAWGFETEAVIALDRVSPTPDWIALEAGVMTNATPGCTLSPRDAVLMCAGEGLSWLVSGDLEAITDLSPAIAELGLADKMGASRGFRTYLPKRPEWGEFLVYKVGEGAPDPRAVRDQWRGLTDSTEFVATLRRLYPGALIHVCHPWSESLGISDNGTGYFYQRKWNVYQMAYDDSKRVEKLEMNVDSASMFHRRGGWQFSKEKDFYFINTLRNRVILPVPACETRVPFLSEPGYPRVLVRTETQDMTRINEELVFSTLKAGRWQITSGPFIDFRADGRREGDLYQPDQNKPFVRYNITAPSWAMTTHISFNLDGIMLWKESDAAETDTNPQRYAFQGPVKLSPHYKENADTLLDGDANSRASIDEMLPRRTGQNIPSVAVNGPVIADTNGNGVWDPPSYLNKGK